MLRYFRGSIIVTVIGLILAFWLGGIKALYITMLLALLEISLSFDNAVVNAKVLNTMDAIWQDRFIIYGIPIAVFGMRFLFPLLIVSIVGDIGIFQTLDIAMNEPDRYYSILQSSEKSIFAFGGSFLLMVFLDFFFEKREIKWIKLVEGSKVVDRFSSVANVELIIAILFGLFLGHFLTENNLVYIDDGLSITLAYFYGILLHSILKSLDDFLSTDTVRSGIAGFLYLEVLDASFSFDGVIGAFAVTSNIFIIMIGLGVGAMFVRSLTILFVERGTLAEFKYLEHGAHYAIGILAAIMLFKIFFHISEVFTGTIGIGLIILAFAHSIYENRRELN